MSMLPHLRSPHLRPARRLARAAAAPVVPVRDRAATLIDCGVYVDGIRRPGRCEPGEDAAAAAVRETYEETGLAVAADRLVGRVERPGPGGVTYVIDDLACTVTGGTLRAGDDADEARWVCATELAALPVTDGLVDALSGWGVLPPR